MKGFLARAGGFSAAMALIASCEKPGVPVEIEAVGNRTEISEVYFIAAADKEHFQSFPARKIVRVSTESAGELTILYRLDGKPYDWKSPALEFSKTASMTVSIDLSALPSEAAFKVSVKKK